MARARRAQLGAQARPTLNSATDEPSRTGTFTGTRLVPIQAHALVNVCLVLVALGCGTRHPEAPRGAHPPNDAVVVPYPPPPAKVEEIPPQPAAACVWTDGYWDFTDRWEWQAGEWVVPAAHCRLAPVELRRQQGQLWHARPRWYPDNVSLLGPQSACPRPPACPSSAPRTPISLQPLRSRPSLVGAARAAPLGRSDPEWTKSTEDHGPSEARERRRRSAFGQAAPHAATLESANP